MAAQQMDTLPVPEQIQLPSRAPELCLSKHTASGHLFTTSLDSGLKSTDLSQ